MRTRHQSDKNFWYTVQHACTCSPHYHNVTVSDRSGHKEEWFWLRKWSRDAERERERERERDARIKKSYFTITDRQTQQLMIKKLFKTECLVLVVEVGGSLSRHWRALVASSWFWKPTVGWVGWLSNTPAWWRTWWRWPAGREGRQREHNMC